MDSKFLPYLLAFLLGGVVYVALELIWRGRSHVSMFLAGGLAVMLLCGIFWRFTLPLVLRCAIGGILITAIEFLAGALVNLRMGRRVWDYSRERYNLYGQVCLRFSVLWCVLTLPIAGVSALLSRLF